MVSLALTARGARVIVVRLPPYVYGRGGSLFVPVLMREVARLGFSAYIGSGEKRCSSVHVDNAARFYLPAAQKATAGSTYNCTSNTTTILRQLAEVIGEAVSVPSRSITREEADQLWNPFLAAFVDYENRASSAKAQEELGWRPDNPLSMLDDIKDGSYSELARQLRMRFPAPALTR